MVLHSRRELLASCAGTLAVVAGCTETKDAATDTDDSEPTFRYSGLSRFESQIHYHPSVDEPVIVDEKRWPPERDLPGDEHGWQFHHSHLMITDDSDRDRLAFRAEPEWLDDARSTIEALDLSEEALYIEQSIVAACREPQLVDVQFEPGRIETKWCGQLRAADVECDADGERLQVLLLGLPEPMDGDPNRRGREWRRDCPPSVSRSSDETDIDGGDDS